jgi:hypothetical protein
MATIGSTTSINYVDCVWLCYLHTTTQHSYDSYIASTRLHLHSVPQTATPLAAPYAHGCTEAAASAASVAAAAVALAAETPVLDPIDHAQPMATPK